MKRRYFLKALLALPVLSGFAKPEATATAAPGGPGPLELRQVDIVVAEPIDISLSDTLAFDPRCRWEFKDARCGYVGGGTLDLEQCDKTSKACSERFDNLINFGGFPEIPAKQEEN